jgi:hypothetical protein
MESEKARQNVRSEVLQDVELVGLLASGMHDPCKNFRDGAMTYCWDNVDIAITIERNGVHE